MATTGQGHSSPDVEERSQGEQDAEISGTEGGRATQMWLGGGRALLVAGGAIQMWPGWEQTSPQI